MRKRSVVTGEPPNPINPPPGCVFHPRCPRATDVCKTVEPPLTEYAGGHLAACHHPLNVSASELAAATVSPASPLSAGKAVPEAAGARAAAPAAPAGDGAAPPADPAAPAAD